MLPSVWKAHVHTALLPPPKTTKLLPSPVMQKNGFTQHTACLFMLLTGLSREVSSVGELSWMVTHCKHPDITVSSLLIGR